MMIRGFTAGVWRYVVGLPLWVVMSVTQAIDPAETVPHTHTTYFEQHAQGWHWYQDPEDEVIEKGNSVLPNTSITDPIGTLKALQVKIKRLKAMAVLSPTEANITAYIKAQNAISARANHFSEVWQQVLLHSPELNFQQVSPTHQLANLAKIDRDEQAKDAAIKTLSETTGLFYFYKGSCPYCQRFAPILKRFAARYGLAVVPISLDGGRSPVFPEAKLDQGQAKRFGVKVTPAVFTVNPYTQKAEPLAYGLTSEADLRRQILTVIAHKTDPSDPSIAGEGV